MNNGVNTKDSPTGEWNRYDVIFQAPEFDIHGKSPILLQDHRDNGRVSYRNIWVRELD